MVVVSLRCTKGGNAAAAFDNMLSRSKSAVNTLSKLSLRAFGGSMDSVSGLQATHLVRCGKW